MEIAEVGKNAVPGESPAGSDIRGEEIFEKLSSEIEKMSSPSAAAGIDWQKVLDISVDILQNYAKDILVTSYLSMALVKTNGLKGLPTGIHVFRDVITTFWETLFPAKARMRGRRNAIDWWVEKMSSALTGLEPQRWQKDEIEALYSDLDAIESFLRDNMDDAPSMVSLVSVIGSLLIEEGSKTVEGKQEEERPQQTGITRGTAQAPSAPSMGPVPSGDDPGPIIRYAIDAMRTASDIMTRKDMLDPLFFRLNRAIAWMTVTDIPPNQNGATMIEPPDEEIRTSLKNMYRSGNWKDLMMACESRIPQYLFWLDLSRYVTEALEQMGKKTIANEVAGATLLYAKRLPGLERLTFSDGTPFADSETRQWLERFDKDRKAPEEAASPDKDLFQQIYAETEQARAAAKGGDLGGAIKSLREKLNVAPSMRERFIRQALFCRFLVNSDQLRLFDPYLNDLIGLIDTYRVEEWEPSLAAQAYSIILTALQSLGTAEYRDISKKVMERLGLLDPAKALDYI